MTTVRAVLRRADRLEALADEAGAAHLALPAPIIVAYASLFMDQALQQRATERRGAAPADLL